MTKLEEERDLRWGKVRAGMGDHGIDCLVIVGNAGLNLYRLADLQYLTGTLREGVLLLPVIGEPVMLSFGGEHDPDAWVTDHRNGYPAFADAITAIINEKGWNTYTFGAILSGYEGDLNFPLKIYQAVRNAFVNASIVDAAPILADARRIKTAYEIRCFRDGCDAGLRGIAAVAAKAKPGIDDVDAKAELVGALLRSGCSTHTLLLFHSGKRTVHGAMGGALPSPKGRTLEEGDIINVEFDAMFNGCCAQFNQPFFIGEPETIWHEIEQIGAESFNLGVASVKPGLFAGELQALMKAPILARGYHVLGPMFHGLGSSFEPPVAQTALGTSFDGDLEMVLEPGMVLELEPHVVSGDLSRGASIGCPILVTPDGCEILAKGWKPAAVKIDV